ncbi:MAG: hypothetical protein ACTSSE_08670 [Candidatus Thorarchaeota archaeon]
MKSDPNQCRHNPKIVCGIMNLISNCPYPIEGDCIAISAINLLGRVNTVTGIITLQKYRYIPAQIHIRILDDNMCDECRVIWKTPMVCPICNAEE